jgi:hypothetical protein
MHSEAVLFLENLDDLKPVEIKAGLTVASAFFDSLKK